MEDVGVRGEVDGPDEGLIVQPVGGFRGGERSRHVGAPVEPPLEGDDDRAPRDVAGQLDRSLDRLRSTVAEEESVEPIGGDCSQGLGQPEQRLVEGDPDGVMDQQPDLTLCGLDHPRMAVPGVGRGDPRREVEISAAVGAVQFEPGCRHQREAGPVLSETGRKPATRLSRQLEERRCSGHLSPSFVVVFGSFRLCQRAFVRGR